MRGDYIRSGLGLALTGIPLISVDAGTVGLSVLGGLTALFAMFGARTVLRQMATVRIDDDRLVTTGFNSRSVVWRDLVSVNMSYYTTRRDGAEGWMQLKISDGRATLRIESTLEGFTNIVERAYRESTARGITLTPKTLNNMQALGLAIQGAGGPVTTNVGSSDRP